MKIVVTGGGSGGHITPLLAVASELKRLLPDCEIIYIGQKGDPFVEVVAHHESVDKVYRIRAGKLRRYHTEGVKQLLDIKTMLLNVRDLFLIGIGILQSIWLIGRIKPASVFIKGGYVGVPVGLASALWRKPYITHDSDAVAGLANKIIARWAAIHAVALPKEQYMYPPAKTITVGVPAASEFSLVHTSEQDKFRRALGLEQNAQVLLITGGGLGAKIINESVVTIASRLLQKYPKLVIVHIAGRIHAEAVTKAYSAAVSGELLERIHVKDYISNLYQYSGAADVIITRAGATIMAELAMQGKASVIIPNPLLAGGHQLKNAEAYEKAGAVKVVQESELRQSPEALLQAVDDLFGNESIRDSLGRRLHIFARSDSAKLLAVTIIKVAQNEPVA